MNLYSHNGFPQTFTAQRLHHSNFKIRSENNPTAWLLPLQSSCIVFLIQPNSLGDTVTAIDQSGYGNTDTTAIFIFTSSISTVRAFSNDKITAPLLQWISIFHAPIIFFDGSSPFVLLSCYFCPMRVLISPSPQLTVILNLHREINEQGYGKSLLLLVATPSVDKFFVRFTKSHSTREDILLANKLGGLYPLFFGPIQNKMNFTLFWSSEKGRFIHPVAGASGI